MLTAHAGALAQVGVNTELQGPLHVDAKGDTNGTLNPQERLHIQSATSRISITGKGNTNRSVTYFLSYVRVVVRLSDPVYRFAPHVHGATSYGDLFSDIIFYI